MASYNASAELSKLAACGVIVQDNVNDFAGRYLSLDGIEEADELLMSVALHHAVRTICSAISLWRRLYRKNLLVAAPSRKRNAHRRNASDQALPQ